MSCPFMLFLVSALLIFSRLGESAKIRRFNYDARLHEHFQSDSRYIQFSRTDMKDWANLEKLTQSRNFTFNSMICTSGPGAWIFYPKENYEMGNSQLYYLVVGEHCVRTDDMISAQPLGKMDETFDQGVMLFSKPDFGSVPTLITEGSGSGEASSIIFSGPTPFQLEGSGKKICLRPGFSIFNNGYCLLPEANISLGLVGSVNVKENCDEGTDIISIDVENCYGDGVHELYTDQDLTVNKLNDVCSGGGDNFTKTKFTILMEFWERRIGQYPSKDQENFEDNVKTAIVWKVLDIYKEICQAVDPLYIYLIGQFYVLHLEHAWNRTNTTKLVNETYRPWWDPIDNATRAELETWGFAAKFLEFCTDHKDEAAHIKIPCKSASDDQYGRNADRGVDMANTWFEIVNGHIFDPVIEQIWLIMNTIIPLCNVYAGYITNDWTELVYLFHRAFLDPVEDQWIEAGDWARVYHAAFHGYDAREQHRNIIGCLEGALRKSPDFDPIGRPKSFSDKALYKYAIPEPGEVKIGPKKLKRSAVFYPPSEAEVKALASEAETKELVKESSNVNGGEGLSSQGNDDIALAISQQKANAM